MATLSSSFSTASCRVGNVVAKSPKLTSSRCCLLSQGLSKDDNKLNITKKIALREDTQSAISLSSRNPIIQAGASSMPVAYEVAKKSSHYSFRTEGCNPVKVSVQKKDLKYSVCIEVSSLQPGNSEGRLVLCWGVYKSDSSSYIPLELNSVTPSNQRTEFETPFTLLSVGTYGLELELESHLAPCYLSFLLMYQSTPTSSISVIESHRKSKFNVPVGFFSGHPSPLGLSFSSDNMMNFALFTRSAHGVSLCLYKDGSSGKPSLEIEVDPYVNRTGGIWHISLYSSNEFSSYGFRCKGTRTRARANKVLLDPYAKVVAKGHGLGELCNPPFDWSGDARPRLPMEKLVLYRLNVKHFTQDKSSKLPSKIAGTFSGVVKKLNHFKDLGINAVLLEPIFPFDQSKGPYHPSHFFSLAGLYGPSRDSASAMMSMKDMVKKLHSCGIEVYLEVNFTHTADGGSLKEIDQLSYYHTHKDLKSENALNCNYPLVQQFILDNLRYWVTEFHIDGFCFVNASHLVRGFHGESLSRPPLIEAITFDPILSDAKIIADCWDPRDLATRNFQFPHWKRWGEMNSRFCYDVRNFLRGESILSSLATRLCGSGDVFSAGRGPSFSFNYIARNSGLPLVDLVSFSRDDLASELSWNCGEEGPTNEKVVLERRLQQIRNFLFVLFVSLGVPVLNMGDEAGQSSGGSTAYGDRKPYNWSALDTAFGKQMTQFISFLCSLRKRRHDLLQKQDFWKIENINWHNTDLSTPGWDDPSAKFLGMTLKPEIKKAQPGSSKSSPPPKGDLYVAFNADKKSKNVILPLPTDGMGWVRLVDTALPYPGFFSAGGEPVPDELAGSVTYIVKSHSCVLFEAKRLD